MSRPRRWTDDQLTAAVAASRTITEVMERLGLSIGGASLVPVRRRMLELGLDRPDLVARGRSAKWAADPDDDLAHAPVRGTWTDDELRMAVLASRSMRQVLQRLGYAPSGGAWTAVQARIRQLDLDTSHFTRLAWRRGRRRAPAPNVRRERWTDAQLVEAVAASTSIAGVLRHLGLRPGGGTYVVMNERIAALALDISHFKGQGWSRGLTFPNRRRRPLAEIMVAHSLYSTNDLRKRLIAEGIKPARCEQCRRRRWNDAPIPLELDHRNGDRTDHRLENLRLLCPNCHAQTETYCGRNVGRIRRSASMGDACPGGGTGQTHGIQDPAPSRHEGSSPSRGTTPRQLAFGGVAALD